MGSWQKNKKKTHATFVLPLIVKYNQAVIMADIDDEESSGDEGSSSSNVNKGQNLAGGDDNEKVIVKEAGNVVEEDIPEDWQPFSDMPIYPKPPVEVPSIDLFEENWGGIKFAEETNPVWPCIALMILGMFLLWYAYLREDSLIN